MTTTIILIVMLGGGFIWAYKVGRKSKDADRLDGHKKAMGNINEFNRQENKDADKHLANSPVRGPWLRKRK
jgi:hypothetical protein